MVPDQLSLIRCHKIVCQWLKFATAENLESSNVARSLKRSALYKSPECPWEEPQLLRNDIHFPLDAFSHNVWPHLSKCMPQMLINNIVAGCDLGLHPSKRRSSISVGYPQLRCLRFVGLSET